MFTFILKWFTFSLYMIVSLTKFKYNFLSTCMHICMHMRVYTYTPYITCILQFICIFL